MPRLTADDRTTLVERRRDLHARAERLQRSAAKVHRELTALDRVLGPERPDAAR